MEKIILGKGQGKTRQLIELSARTGDLIVCHNSYECNRVYLYAIRNMGVNIPVPITYKEFINRQYRGYKVTGLLIDNIDMFIQSLANVPINAITLTI